MVPFLTLDQGLGGLSSLPLAVYQLSEFISRSKPTEQFLDQ